MKNYIISALCVSRGMKSQDLDTPAIEKRFAYTFLHKLITYVDQAHQHMMEFGEVPLTSTESSTNNNLCQVQLLNSTFLVWCKSRGQNT